MNRLRPYLLLVVGLVPTIVCWAELLYRIRLYRQYGSHPFLNHVEDWYFGFMYSVAGVGAATLVAGLVLAVRSGSSFRIAACLGASGLAVVYMGVLCFMNHQDMLVTYSEFARNLGP